MNGLTMTCQFFELWFDKYCFFSMELVRFTLEVRELIADGLIRHNKTIFDGFLLNICIGEING